MTALIDESNDKRLQPFSQKSRTTTVAKEFQIGLYDDAEADLEHFRDCCSAGFWENGCTAATHIAVSCRSPQRGRVARGLDFAA